MRTVVLLTISNIFMTFAWYGHLKYRSQTLWKVIAISWGIAFFEYCFQVPANRIGSYEFTTAQLKTIQEVITLSVFAVFFGAVFGGEVEVELRDGVCVPGGGSVFCFSQVVRAPNDNVLANREVQQRLVRGQGEASGFSHGVTSEFRLGRLQLPGMMVNVTSKDAATQIGGVQAVTFGEEVHQGSGRGLEDFAAGPVDGLQQPVGRAAMGSLAGILDPVAGVFAFHTRAKIGQMKPGTSYSNSERICRVQTEEPNAGFSLRDDVGSYVELGKSGEPR